MIFKLTNLNKAMQISTLCFTQTNKSKKMAMVKTSQSSPAIRMMPGKSVYTF